MTNILLQNFVWGAGDPFPWELMWRKPDTLFILSETDIDGQVFLVRLLQLVCLETDNFCLFLF